METITEDYCSYEVAKLLKEKGFDEPCYRIYNTEEKELWGTDGIVFYNHEIDQDMIAAPTHQMAMAWLREKGVYMYVEPFITISSKGYNLEGYKPWVTTFKRNWLNPLPELGKIVYTQTYEEAIEAALKYTLEKLI